MSTKQSLFDRFSQQTDIHQTPMYAQVMRDLGWLVIGQQGTQIFVRKIGPIAVAKIQRPSILHVEALDEIRRKYHTILMQIEPSLRMKIGQKLVKFPQTYDKQTDISQWMNKMKTAGLSKNVSPLAHSATSIIDISLSEKELLTKMKRVARYNIGITKRETNLKIHTIPIREFTQKNREDFFEVLAEWSKRKHVYGFEPKLMNAVLSAFNAESWCHFGEINGKLESTALMLKVGKVMIYYCAVSSEKGYANRVPTALLWESIVTGKKLDCEFLDFGGIYDPRYADTYKRWGGFTTFKEKFAPTPFLYPPSFRLRTGWW